MKRYNTENRTVVTIQTTTFEPVKTNLKTPILSAIAFFCTLGILSVGYSAYVSSYPATATAGVTSLSAGEWNKMVSALQALDGKLSTFALSGSNV